jgi:hypothetical protein
MSDLSAALKAYQDSAGIKEKGALSTVLKVTEHAKNMGLPLDYKKLMTTKGGQVKGPGVSVKAILQRHGINRKLSSEGGRTSRGSIDTMRNYVNELNRLAAEGPLDLNEVERYWAQAVEEYFRRQPFKINLDGNRSLRLLVRDIVGQADKRQTEAPGMMIAGAVMQHLVGAKLDCALEIGQFEHNSFSTSDAQSGRAGDFSIGDVAIHVTTSPGEGVVQRCKENLDEGLRPIIVTTARGLSAAEVLAENAGIGDRVDVFEVEQFVALNLYELGKFAAEGRKVAVGDLVARYNEIVKEVETDPSLMIEIRK